ncbi:MAG: PD40 domain-containing protein [Gammaproteobacteria bacterium]|nr:PD40 domain-containing protein [Gammaproteobacteria bacterium]
MQFSQVILIPCLAVTLAACGGSSNTTPPPVDNNLYTAFGAPEQVTIVGYTGDAMEPFLSRDGQFLFFNSYEGASDKDLYYASKVDDTHFTYLGEVLNINTIKVDGVASMDNADNFFWVSTDIYAPPATYDTLFSGTFDGTSGEISDASAVTGLAEGINGHLNFDLEISPDGNTLYFVDGVFSGAAHPDQSNIAIAIKNGSDFSRHPGSNTLMANINTDDLEYAPTVSANGLELFFTRMDPDTLQPKTYRSIRDNTVSVFQTPQEVSAITGFAEAPAFSPDEKSLYFHKLEGSTFVIYKIERP